MLFFAVLGADILFLSTLSLRRATPLTSRTETIAAISIHALLAESDPSKLAKTSRTENISIHALLAESDRLHSAATRKSLISIHALLAESDSAMWTFQHGFTDFYPRSPCGERLLLSCRASVNLHFYPRSPCGERHFLRGDPAILLPISIHALLAESDCSRCPAFRWTANFYPRSPCGERHNSGWHACCHRDFYPRSPCGERHTPILQGNR